MRGVYYFVIWLSIVHRCFIIRLLQTIIFVFCEVSYYCYVVIAFFFQPLLNFFLAPPLPRSMARVTGLTIMLISASVGINFGVGGVGLILSFMSVLVGANLVAFGVRMAADPAPAAPVVPAVFAGARALAAFPRRNLTAVWLFMASCAVAAVSGGAGPVLCFGMSALLLVGLSLISVGILGQ